MSEVSDLDRWHDWSRGWRLLHLREPRAGFWRPDYLEYLARWAGLAPGQTLLDVGCGLAFLGDLLGPFIAPSGRYLGVDPNERMIELARAVPLPVPAELFATDGEKLPLPDGSVDVAACHSVLMHVGKPEALVAEMARVVKPGGRVLVFEPDMLAAVGNGWSTAAAVTQGASGPVGLAIGRRLEHLDYQHKVNEGRKALGFGDWAIGPRVAHLLARAGLGDVEALTSNNPQALVPPYDSAQSKERLSAIAAQRRFGAGLSETELSALADDFRREHELTRRFYLAGGGDAGGFERMARLMPKMSELMPPESAIAANAFYAMSTAVYYVARGIKRE